MLEQALWKYILERKLDKKEQWIKSLKIEVNNLSIKIIFPHVFFHQWFINNKKSFFEQIISDCFNNTYKKIIYEDYISNKTILSKKNIDIKKKEIKKDNPNIFLLNTQEYKTKSLENFIISNQNDFCLSSLAKIGKAKPGSVYPKVLIYGKTGTGKTHLLISLAKKILEYSNKVLICNTQTLNLYSSIISDPEIFWQNYIALLIDDIQDIKNQLSLQYRIISLFDYCPKGRQIVFTCLDNEKKINELELRLTSRILSGLILNISEPDIDVRLKLVKSICSKKNIDLNSQQMLSIAQNTNNFRQIQSKIT